MCYFPSISDKVLADGLGQILAGRTQSNASRSGSTMSLCTTGSMGWSYGSASSSRQEQSSVSRAHSSNNRTNEASSSSVQRPRKRHQNSTSNGDNDQASLRFCSDNLSTISSAENFSSPGPILSPDAQEAMDGNPDLADL